MLYADDIVYWKNWEDVATILELEINLKMVESIIIKNKKVQIHRFLFMFMK